MESPKASQTTSEKSPRRRRWLLAGICMLLLLLLGDYFLYPLLAPMAGSRLNRGENGLWLRYTWYFGQYLPPRPRRKPAHGAHRRPPGPGRPHTLPSAFAGIAPFADYTTTAEDWREYKEDLLGE